ncbi:MAG: hypothetical protein KDB61_08790 [Planctomycetes bacterium]|nr:hypothetical protein [Planctomycetota bacterium]
MCAHYELTDRDSAAALELGSLAGLVSTKELVAWADSVIGAQKSPPDWAICLSTVESQPLANVVELLRQVPGDRDLEKSWRMFCGLLLRRIAAGVLDESRANRIMTDHFYGGYVPESHRDVVGYLDYGFELGRSGVCELDQARERLKDYLRENRLPWNVTGTDS